LEALSSPFGRALPPLPEDFLGRTVDVWEVMQHLCDRRAVVVCGAMETAHGIGKSAVLDAVHRAFALQMGGVCVAVHLRALRDADTESVSTAFGWIEKLKAKVQVALEDYQEQLCRSGSIGRRSTGSSFAQKLQSGSLVSSVLCTGGALRRRKVCHHSVSRGFHPLSDPVATAPALEELMEIMLALTECCEERNRASPTSMVALGKCSSGVRILLLLHECDHLIQQRHFQDSIAEVLRRCSAFSVVLSTQQQMVETGGRWFKVVHKQVSGLAPEHAARLFLRRAHRPIYWDELVDADASSTSMTNASAARNQVIMTRDNEADVLAKVAAHSLVAAQRGNPRKLIELASQVRNTLHSLSDLTA
jgi:hypothetical protein